MEVPLQPSYAGEVQGDRPEAALVMDPGKEKKKEGGLSVAAGRVLSS